jgi:allantoin racemase
MGEYPPAEAERRQQAVLACASPDTRIEFGIMKTSLFGAHNDQVSALLAAPLVAEIAQRAEADGFDAVVPFGSLDIGVELARNLVRIPVVGAGQSVLHLAAQLSSRIGVIIYTELNIPFVRKNIQAWGLLDVVAAIRAVNIPLEELTTQRASLRERFVDLGRGLIEQEGVEVIVPLGVTMVVQYSAPELSAALGVPVLDTVAASIHTAETMVRMGLVHSLKTYPAPVKE